MKINNKTGTFSYLILLSVLLLACSKTPQETVEKDVLTYLKVRYKKPFVIAEYKEKSNPGLGYDHHFLQVYPQGEPGKKSLFRINYHDDRSFIINDYFLQHSDISKEDKKVLGDYIENNTESSNYDFSYSSKIYFNNQDSLKKLRFDNKMYGDTILVKIAITTTPDKKGQIPQYLIKYIVNYYKKRSDYIFQLRVDLYLYPKGAEIEGDIYDLQFKPGLKLIDHVFVELNKSNLDSFDGSAKTLERIIHR